MAKIRKARGGGAGGGGGGGDDAAARTAQSKGRKNKNFK